MSTRNLPTADAELAQQAVRRGVDLRRAFVTEGRKMFEENGATELSIRAIGRRLGVSEAAPFKHFKSKEHLLAAIASSGFRELAEQRKLIVDSVAAPATRAREMMLSYVDFACAHQGLFDLMIGPRLLAEVRDGELEDAGNASFSYFANSIHALALESGWTKERLDVLAHAAWTVEHGIASLILARQLPRKRAKLTQQQIVSFAIDIFLSAIAAGPTQFKNFLPAHIGRTSVQRPPAGTGRACLT
ncbi:TetR/AcrR family transcriptional regulator [Variovorax sp. J22G21]|uniref:TetR/AcrR family transcriptional regulator n=1 Tax=Variovorax fucosicus TaxID=3053517 RepID=UPI002577C662|nr:MULTISPECIES: TetR/AcrR family transcriptional regulator [unclassified Variovorax]MDM0042762.1 TetR/AcrR family transcriptional regulator [Variovorax sp. J22R193]MDM0064843.1 TetR/AcrR family transcriptional regulator [Variovorax sp. J22G21]